MGTTRWNGVSIAVITDLDGSLLDARDYGFGPARGVLRHLRRSGVPLVLCTSKTRAEVRALRVALGGPDLAVVEDGGGLLVPPGALPRVALPTARRTVDGRLLALATSYARIRRAFREFRRHTRAAVVGFGDLSTAEIAAITNLPPAAARRAAQREFDEPFFFDQDGRRYAPVLRRLAKHRGLVITRGGRFYHLHGPTDKGRATRLIRELLQLENRGKAVALIALGDSALDAPMLREADVPVIVPHPDGRPDPALRQGVPGARIAPAPGPAGWARAVHGALRRYGIA